MSLFYRVSEVELTTLQSIYDEVEKNKSLFAPLCLSFGQYVPQTTSREVLVLRSLSANYENKKYPNLNPNPIEEIALWERAIDIFPYTKKLIDTLVAHFGSPLIGKVMFARMPSLGTMNWHVDPYPLFSGFSRLHIPIKSSLGASDFYTEKGNFSMALGGVYLYDTSLVHTAKNNSLSDRIHLIIDLWLPRAKYFPEVFYLWEEIFLAEGKIFENYNKFEEQLESARKKYASLLLFFCIWSESNNRTKLFFLWASTEARKVFFEEFDIENFLNQLFERLEIRSGHVRWDESYQLVDKNRSKTTIVVCRSDYQ